MTEERDYEAEAAEQGWNKDYDGPNKTDAKTFVERGEQIAGILKSKNARLEERIGRLEQTNREFGDHFKQTLEAQKQSAEVKIAGLKEKLAQAITDGDGQQYNMLNEEIERAQRVSQPAPAQNQNLTELQAKFIKDNPWYTKDKTMAALADGLADRLLNEGYLDGSQAFFGEIEREVKEAFPDKFKNPKKSAANAVEAGGQRGTTSSKDQTYENLPADAKAACDKYVRDGIFKKREDYVETYEW